MTLDLPTIDRSLIPGEMKTTLTRDLDDGSKIEFSEAPAGWLTKKGEPRTEPWRAYHYTTASSRCEPCEGTGRLFDRSERGRNCPACSGTGDGAERTRFESVTGIVDAICPKPGLPPWAEARGIEGAHQAWCLGLVDADTPPERVIEIVREHGLGADKAKLEAADRGLNVHALLEHYMRTGTAPAVHGHPEHHHGFIRGLSRFLLAFDPQPRAVEQVVVHPELAYAGRVDLVADVENLLTTIDAKTQEKGGIYTGAHVQVGLYEGARRRCGDEPASRLIVVVFAADGNFRVMEASHPDSFIDAALAWRQQVKPIDSACESQNRIEREARKAVAA